MQDYSKTVYFGSPDNDKHPDWEPHSPNFRNASFQIDYIEPHKISIDLTVRNISKAAVDGVYIRLYAVEDVLGADEANKNVTLENILAHAVPLAKWDDQVVSPKLDGVDTPWHTGGIQWIVSQGYHGSFILLASLYLWPDKRMRPIPADLAFPHVREIAGNPWYAIWAHYVRREQDHV